MTIDNLNFKFFKYFFNLVFLKKITYLNIVKIITNMVFY